MKNKNNKTLILTSILCLLPIIMSCVVYNDLPEQIAVHWDIMGNPDNFLPKAAAAFGLPFMFLVTNIFTVTLLLNDPKRANASKAMRILTMCILPFLSLTIMPITLCIAMGINIPIFRVVFIIVGVIFILIGNYLPKTRQNYTIGIRLPWTLSNADNWNKTHRMAGYLYIAAGILFISLAFITFRSGFWSLIIIFAIILIALIPAAYSFLLYKKTDDSHEVD